MESIVGQEWAKKMFSTLEHPFGTVARNSNQQFRFEITNLYEEDVHIASVRASCGCTLASIEKPTLKSFEKGAILTTYNTKNFVGSRGATVTVTIDKPYFAEVQLQVSGFIRSDVVISPNSLEFGEFQVGSRPRQEFRIRYAGRTDWMITDVRSKQSYYQVEIIERAQLTTGVEYLLAVQLKENIPVGYLKDYLIIVTNDPQNRQIQLPLTGKVAAPVTLSPAALLLGIIQSGDELNNRMVLKSDKPFTITNIACDHPAVSFGEVTEAKKLHLIPVTLVAGTTPEKIQATITVTVNTGQEIILTCPLSATVE